MGVLDAIRARLAAVLHRAAGRDRATGGGRSCASRIPAPGRHNDRADGRIRARVIRACSASCRASAATSARSRRRSCSNRTTTASGPRPRNSAYTPVLRPPNRYQTPQQFHEQVVLSLLLHGNAYVLKNRDERGVVNALYVLIRRASRCWSRRMAASITSSRRTTWPASPADEPPIVVPAREIIHIRWNCLSHQLMGVSPLYALAGAVAQAQAIQASSTAFFNNGGRPPGVLIAPTKLDPLSAARVERSKPRSSRASGTLILGTRDEIEAMPTRRSTRS